MNLGLTGKRALVTGSSAGIGAGIVAQLAQEGAIAFDFGSFWFKGQKMGTGQANVKAYNRKLRELIHVGKAKPSMIVSHELPLAEAPGAYRNFDDRTDGWTKVILKPAA